MSGSQATLADRTPSILNKEPADKKSRNDRSPVPLKHEFDPTGLVQRCVIIQRDENGFGLTVSGDNPVFVQLVKEDGAARRAGVQTGDRIIKVNGTLVTHSNHIEVVKLIKSGSYVALTVLGRPPGLPQIPLEEEEHKGPSVPGPLSPMLSGGERSSPPCSPQEQTTPRTFEGDESRHTCSSTNALQRTEEQLELQGKALYRETENGYRGSPQTDQPLSVFCDSEGPGQGSSNSSLQCSRLPESPGRGDTPCQSPAMIRRDSPDTCPSPVTEDIPEHESIPQSVASPPYHLHPQIIGAEDDYFDSQQEQINGQCSCFQSVELLKCRPAHLAVFLHHVVSQFDPAPLLCYLYADLHKQTSAKESRRFFLEFHSLFLDQTAHLKVQVPESLTSDLEKRRLELIPEELCKQYTQLLQDSLLPDLLKNLDDFRQKRSMGLTLAEEELSKLDLGQAKEQQALDKECSCAEHILSKIEDIIMTSQPLEEEKCTTMQYVILTYMKHLGVKVKEPRGLEHKRARINFLPKMKKSIKIEKEGEEKVRKRFITLVPPRRLSRVESTSVGKAVEMNKQRSPKQLPQPSITIPDQPVPSPSTHLLPLTSSPPTHSSPMGHTPDSSGHDSDYNLSPQPLQSRLSEGPESGENQEGLPTTPSTQFDFSPSNVEQLQEEDHEMFSRRMEAQGVVGSADVLSEDDQSAVVECEEDPPTWQSVVSRDVLANLKPREIERQEVINELFYTERTHVRKLKVLDCVFYQRLSRDSILPAEDLRNIFSNLQEIIQLHAGISEQMTAVRKRSETSVIGQIGDDLLGWFSGEEEEKINEAVGTFCSNLPSALELIKTRQKKDQRFALFMQEAESNRLCRRLQLKDIIPVEMQRLTKYPLLLDNIAKYTDDMEERKKVRKAAECCKKILNHINQSVKEAENQQRLREYQRRLDLSSLKQNENPIVLELKNLDLTKRKLVHEGPLSWKLTKDKTIELYTILLEDILVLLQKQDERLILKFHGKNLASAADPKQIFSPVIKLSTVLVRPVATDHRSFFVLSMSDNVAQIYELTAQTASEQRTWQCLITQSADAMKAQPHSRDTGAAQSDDEHKVNEIINNNGLSTSKEPCITSSGSEQCSDISSEVHTNPFDGIKSDNEEERPDEEDVDEAELEAFLDGQLADRLEQEPNQDNSITNALNLPPSKAEDALRTLSMLKQLLLNHMISSETEERDGPSEGSKPTGAPGSPQPESPEVTSVWDQSSESAKQQPQHVPSEQAEPSDQHNGGFVVLDLCGGSEESTTDVGIDMRKLLSSSSQTGRAGPNLSRQLMTHLRLLQADLQYLKDVEVKYKELQQNLSDTTTDSDDYNDLVV